MIEKLLSRLDSVRQNGQNKWMAQCPAHADKRASLSIRLTDNRKTLIHCFAGCSVPEVVSAVGLEVSDLYPKRDSFDPNKKHRRERVINPSDGLRLIDYEAGVLHVCASDMERCARTGEPLSPRTLPAIVNAQKAIQAVIREALL